MTDLDRLLQRQSEALASLTDNQARAMLAAYEDARRELAEKLSRLPPGTFTAHQMAATQAQVQDGIHQLQERLGRQMTEAAAQAQEKALSDLLAVLGSQEPDFRGAAGAIEVATATRLAAPSALLLHQHSIQQYGADLASKIQASLVQSMIQRLTVDQMVARIAAREGSVIAGGRGRIELIVRMEGMRAYDAGHQASLEEAASQLDDPDDPDPLLARADEYIDGRNNPFSRVLDGQTRTVKGVWTVSCSEVEAESARMKRRGSGILWPVTDGAYAGSTYPAHFGDRGRQTPWRESWRTKKRSVLEYLASDQNKTYSIVPRSPSLGEEATLQHILSSRKVLEPGTRGVLLTGVESASWFQGNTFDPDKVPRALLSDVYRLSRKLGGEVAVIAEDGRVRLVSGGYNNVGIPPARAGLHVAGHTHPSDPRPSKKDIEILAARVERMQKLGLKVAVGDMPSVIISGLDEDSLVIFYGNP